MRPKQIRVFDGLRITTEHLNHLQGALYSGLQDSREIHGLGRVHRGFEVVASGENSFTIHPGLAFDHDGNRVVSDESKTVKLTLDSEASTAYLCLKYEQVEEGQVEGQFTLIWDSCLIVIRPNLPEPKENLLPLAKIVKEKNENLHIENLVRQEEKAPEDNLSDIEDSKFEVSKLETWNLQVQQGIVRFTKEGTKEGNLQSLIELLRNAKENSNEILLQLEEKEVVPSFPVLSLSCNVTINLSFKIPSVVSIAEMNGSTKEEMQTNDNLRFQSTSHGEVDFSSADILQFGISNTYCHSCLTQNIGEWCSSELTDRGVAYLSLKKWVVNFNHTDIELLNAYLQSMNFLVRVERSNGGGFRISCYLLWIAGVNDEIITKYSDPSFFPTWDILVLWKSLGIA